MRSIIKHVYLLPGLVNFTSGVEGTVSVTPTMLTEEAESCALSFSATSANPTKGSLRTFNRSSQLGSLQVRMLSHSFSIATVHCTSDPDLDICVSIHSGIFNFIPSKLHLGAMAGTTFIKSLMSSLAWQGWALLS